MTEQGTIYIQGWNNGVQELSDFSDIYFISEKGIFINLARTYCLL
mgnify:CR=1 FL=1